MHLEADHRVVRRDRVVVRHQLRGGGRHAVLALAQPPDDDEDAGDDDGDVQRGVEQLEPVVVVAGLPQPGDGRAAGEGACRSATAST